MLATRQAQDELGELPRLAVDRDRPAMLLRDDVVADREAKASALACRLGGEERLEQLVAVLGRDADSVVAHPDLDLVLALARRHRQGRPKIWSAPVALPLGRGIKPIAEKVQKHPCDLLRGQFDRRKVAGEVALQTDVEALV